MIPVLYGKNETLFEDNGIGSLSDAESCFCTEVLNEEYELELKMPVLGVHSENVVVNNIIKAKPNYIDRPQPFRIYSVQKDINGIVTVKASHISYDVVGIPIMPFEAENLEAAIDNINNKQNCNHPSLFTVYTNFEAEGTMKITTPSPMKTLLGDGENAVLGLYKGEYHYDYYDIELLEKRGVDKGIVFRSGKNLVEFHHEENSEEAYSAILGFWKKNDNPDLNVYSDIYSVNTDYTVNRIKVLEITSKQLEIGSATPTVDQLNEYLEKYLNDNNLSELKYTIDVKYAEDDNITKVNLGDTVGILLPEYRIRTTARCTKVVFDSLLERNDSIDIGEVDSGIVGEVADLSE